jgi:predicted esterase
VFSVGSVIVAYSRTDTDGTVRPIPTKIYYPSTSSGSNPAVASGRFPLILFSHGTGGTYDGFYAPPIEALVSAGFIVAAPEYMNTKAGSSLDLDDVWKGRNSLDAEQVITDVLALDTTVGDKLFGHVDGSRGVGAAGHSSGGMTTDGMIGLKRDSRIVAATIFAGLSLGPKTGSPVKVLFEHGDADPTLKYSDGMADYTGLPSGWPKAFMTHVGEGHWQYLVPGHPTYPQAMLTATDWFRWGLYGDAAAKARLTADYVNGALTTWKSANL